MSTPNEKKARIILIDGNAIIHRSYHALPPFRTNKGELVNAVYGFASTLLAVIDKFSPEYIVATFDLKAPTFRHKKFKEYKATRVKAPDDLYAQIERVKEITRAFGIPIYEKEGFEADDIIGTIAKQITANNPELEVIIVTGDLDTLQLVNKQVKVWTVSRGINKAVLYDQKAVRQRYELEPKQLRDYKGLRGDVSDNIPGVKGIGDKGAINLLKKYQSLEGVYENIAEIKGALREKLKKNKQKALLSKELGTIKTDVPIKFDLAECKTEEFDKEKLVELFQKLGFRSLIKRLDKNKKLNGAKGTFKNEKEEVICKIVDEKNEKDFLKELSEQKEVVLVTNSNNFKNSETEAVFLWKDTDRKAFFVKFSVEKAKRLKPFLESVKIKKIGWKLKNDYKYFRKRGLRLNLIDFADDNEKEKEKRKVLCQDVMLVDYLLNSGAEINLDKSVLKELDEEVFDKKGQLSLLDEPSVEEISRKLCVKAKQIGELRKILEEKLEEINKQQKKFGRKGLQTVLEKVELPLIVVLAEMELTGIKVNKIIFQGIAEKISAEVKKLENKIQDLAGEKFNVNSTQQLSKILFEKLKISSEGIKKNKTGFSTAASELHKLKGRHKIIEKIEKYRELFKLKTTYLDTFPGFIQTDGRIHTTFNQAVTATGRLSSENPNLQNIPIRTDLGKIIRTAFEAEEGYLLISADYSQIDLRVMAHMSRDKKLMEAFWAGEDIHTKTASEINDVPVSKVTKKMRYQAKALNFGIIYGMGSFGFSQSAGIAQEDAKKFISEYLREFSGVAKFIKQTKEFAKKNGYVETEMGRRRYLPEINSPNFQIQAGAERMAINMPIQGLAADIMKLAMIAVYEFYREQPDVKMILQIHDEIILEVKEGLVEEVSRQVKKIMEEVYNLAVPLTVDVKIGKNWGEL